MFWFLAFQASVPYPSVNLKARESVSILSPMCLFFLRYNGQQVQAASVSSGTEDPGSQQPVTGRHSDTHTSYLCYIASPSISDSRAEEASATCQGRVPRGQCQLAVIQSNFF